MRIIIIMLSLIGLCLTVIPSFFVFSGSLSWLVHVQMMAAGMILWFIFAPLWINK